MATNKARWLPLALLCCQACAPHTPTPQLGPPSDPFAATVVRVRYVMGSMLKIAVDAPESQWIELLIDEAFSRAQALDKLLSNYDQQSALSRFNREGSVQSAMVPPGLYACLRLSKEYSRQTDGAFDITVGALVLLHRRTATPKPEQLKAAIAGIGDKHLRLLAANRATMDHPQTQLDMGAIGKGFAVDAIIDLLKERRITSAFVDFGGSSFFGLGKPRGLAGWPVALGSGQTVALVDRALSSSNSQHTGKNDALEFHIIDPRSGQLVNAKRFVAVTAHTATQSEVWSTALVVDPSLAELAKRVGVRIEALRTDN